MASIFRDGAEFGDTLAWDIVGGGVSASNAVVRSGSYAYATNSGSVQKNFTAISEFYIRVAFNTTALGANGTPIIWLNGGTTIGRLLYDTGTNTLSVQRGTTTVASGTINFVINNWYLIEVHVKVADVGGAFDVKVDGVTDITFSGDTKPGADTTVDNITIGRFAGAGTSYFDDIALNDTTGGANNTWPGDGHIILLKPNGNGDASQLTNTGGTSVNNYSYVDDIPPDGDTSYVEGTVLNNRDLYALEDFGVTSVTISNVWVEARARDTVAAGGQCALIIKTGGVEYDSSAISLLTTYTAITGTVYDVNPNTTVAWTDGDLDALQAGFEIR